MTQSYSVTATLRARDANFTSTFQKASGLLRSFSGNTANVQRSGRSVTSTFKSMVSAIGLVKVATAGYNTVMQNMRSAMSRQDTLYLYNRNLRQMGYTADVVKGNQAQLSDAVQDTNYALDSAANATQSFANAGYDLEKSTKYSTRFMDLISRYGDGTNQTYKQVMLQMNQMASKGKANLGDIKSAVEAQIPVWKILSEKTGQSVEEIQDKISAGEMTATEFFDALVEGSNDAAGAAKDGAKTWSGAIGIMKSRIALGVGDILTSFKHIGKKITGDDFGIYKAITNLGSKIRSVFSSAGNLMVKAFDVAYPYIQKTINILQTLKTKIAYDVAPYIKILQDAFVSIKDPIIKAVSAVAKAVNKNFTDMYNQADRVTALKNFQTYIDQVANRIKNLSKFIENNADVIGKLILILPKLVVGFKALQFVSTVGANFLDVSNKVVQLHSKLLSLVDLTATGFTKGVTVAKSGLSKLATGFTSVISVSSNFARGMKNPIVSLASFSVAAGGTGTALNGLGLGFIAMSKKAGTAIRGVTKALLSSGWGAVLIAVGVAVASMAAAWHSNFMNIQGFTKSVFGVIGKSLKSLGGLFKGILPSIKSMSTVFKTLGAILGGALSVGLAVVIDAFRFLVTNTMTVVRGLMILGKAAAMVGKALTGDWEGAGKEFDNIKDDINTVIDGYKKLGTESATVGVLTKSTKELGKETTKAKATVVADLNEVAESTRSLSDDFNSMGQELVSAFDVEGSTDSIKKYFETANDTIYNYQLEREQIINKSNEIIKAAQDKSDEEKRKAMIQASELVLNDTSKYNQGMLALYSEYSTMLKNNKDIEGKELTEQQRTALQQQTDAIRKSLQEQNQLYVDMAVQKLANDEKLSEQERTAAMANMTALYNNKKEEIVSNEQKIEDLKKQIQEAKTESERQNYQAQLEALKANNEQIRNEYVQNGEKLLAILTNNGEVNANTVLAGMEKMGNITDEELAGLYQAFVNSGNDINQQMFLLGGILEQRGMEGSNKLVQALKAGDLSAVAGQMTDEMIAGLQALPKEMFWEGDVGKESFLNALKSGNAEGAGKFLVDATEKGMSTGKDKSQKKGKESGKAHNDGVESQKSNSNKAGKDIAQAVADGEKQKKGEHNSAGKGNASAYVSGVDSQKGNASNAGKDLASNAKSGAGTVSFNSVGSNMALGVAAGIQSSTPDAVAAMRSLVDQVNAEAKKKAEIKSPSRLLKRDVGVYLGLGVAAGIKESTKEAVANAHLMIEKIKETMVGGAKGVNGPKLEIEHKIENPLITKLNEMIDRLNNMQVVLNTGALVGGVGYEMDGYLGERYKRDRRYK